MDSCSCSILAFNSLKGTVNMGQNAFEQIAFGEYNILKLSHNYCIYYNSHVSMPKQIIITKTNIIITENEHWNKCDDLNHYVKFVPHTSFA